MTIIGDRAISPQVVRELVRYWGSVGKAAEYVGTTPGIVQRMRDGEDDAQVGRRVREAFWREAYLRLGAGKVEKLLQEEGKVQQKTGKMCSKCKDVKPHAEFYRQASARDGLMSHCKVCHRAYERRGREYTNGHSEYHFRLEGIVEAAGSPVTSAVPFLDAATPSPDLVEECLVPSVVAASESGEQVTTRGGVTIIARILEFFGEIETDLRGLEEYVARGVTQEHLAAQLALTQGERQELEMLRAQRAQWERDRQQLRVLKAAFESLHDGGL